MSIARLFFASVMLALMNSASCAAPFIVDLTERDLTLMRDTCYALPMFKAQSCMSDVETVRAIQKSLFKYYKQRSASSNEARRFSTYLRIHAYETDMMLGVHQWKRLYS